MSRIDLRLRPPQVRYLEYVAERDEVSFSRAFATVVELYAPNVERLAALPQPDRRVVFLPEPNLAVLDRLAMAWQITRAETARRLIDDARREFPRLALTTLAASVRG